MKEGGKFEELVVASNEIAASTAQLVSVVNLVIPKLSLIM